MKSRTPYNSPERQKPPVGMIANICQKSERPEHDQKWFYCGITKGRKNGAKLDLNVTD